MKKMKTKYEENKNILPTMKTIKATLNNNEKFLDQHTLSVGNRDIFNKQYDELVSKFENAQKNINKVIELADDIDNLIEEIGYEQKINKIRESLKNEYNSFKKLNDPKVTKNEAAKKFQKEMNEYLEISLDKSNNGGYSDNVRKEKPEEFFKASMVYLEHLNKQMEGKDAREVLRAYQEKAVMVSMFRKMEQLTEYYADAELDKVLKKETEQSTADRKIAEAAVAKLRDENKARDAKFNQEVEELNKYVKNKAKEVEDALKKTDDLEKLNEDFDKEAKNAIEESKKSTEEAKAEQKAKNAAFENGRDKDHTDDKATLDRNEAVKTALVADENDLQAEIRSTLVDRSILDRELASAKKNHERNVYVKNDLRKLAKNGIDELAQIDRYMDNLKSSVKEANEIKDENESVNGMSEVIKICDSQLKFEGQFKRNHDKLHEEYEDWSKRALKFNDDITKTHKAVLDKQAQINQNLANEKATYDKITGKFIEAGRKHEELLGKLKVKQHEDAIRREIKEAFDAVKDSKDRGIGSHEKFNNFKAAMQHYLEAHPDGHPNENLSAEDAKNLRDSAYQSCIEYVNRHLKTSKGLQSLGHQGTNEGALRKQGTVRILELMNELPEFKDKFELKQDAPQVEENAPAAKADANNDKRVKLNFNQLKESLGKNSKTVKTKKKEDFSKNAYADLNAEISKKANKEDKGDKGKQR